MTRTKIDRHYGMDWLRVGAFAILILYHIGMVFVPWPFHINAVPAEPWVRLPMLAVNAWRLTLLFVVSGYASRALLRRSPRLGHFLARRTWRLLVPLAFGVAVVVPPQAWVELVTKYNYARGYPAFWAHDYFGFRTIAGIALPTWNHLWFVGYLWLYTVVLCMLAAIMGRLRHMQRAFDRTFGGIGLLVIPIVYLLCVHTRWFPMVGETHALLGDWIAHVSYFPAFLFGFALAASKPGMAAIARWWPVAAALAIIGYAVILAIELRGFGATFTPVEQRTIYGAAHAVQQWTAIVALIGIAERFLNRDAAIRPMLTEAVFPFYIVHQTIIVVVMYWLIPLALSGWAEFAALIMSTIAGCWLFYLVGREVPVLRPLIGLRLHKSPRKPAIV